MTLLRQEREAEGLVAQIEASIRNLNSVEVEIFTLEEAVRQASGRYLAAIAKGDRLLEDRLRFRRQTAAHITEERYKDMAFRVFRNDALQKYRGQFDLAARYVYLAAKAYDYETNLLDGDSKSGKTFSPVLSANGRLDRSRAVCPWRAADWRIFLPAWLRTLPC